MMTSRRFAHRWKAHCERQSAIIRRIRDEGPWTFATLPWDEDDEDKRRHLHRSDRLICQILERFSGINAIGNRVPPCQRKSRWKRSRNAFNDRHQAISRDGRISHVRGALYSTRLGLRSSATLAVQ